MKNSRKKTIRSNRKPKQNNPLLIAHRGGNVAGTDRENTIAAFKKAVELGYRYLETDVLLSRDGQVVAYHGSRNRYFALKTRLMLRRKLEELNYSEIQKSITPGGEKPPLLDELIELFPECRLKIDAKTDKVYKPLIKLLVDRKVLDKVCIATFNPWRMRRIQKELAFYGAKPPTELIISPTMVALLKISGLFNWYVLRAKTDIIGLPQSFITRRIVKSLHKKNKSVYAWTVNREKSMKRMVSNGVDGIISDEIILLKRTISSL